MQVRRIRGIVAALMVLGGVSVALPTSSVGAVGPCSPTATRTLSAAQTAAFTTTLAANERVDATSASWTGTTAYPVYFDSGADSCWDGASVNGAFPVTTPWSIFHGNTGVGFGGANFTLSNPRVFNYGDGISVKTGSDNFLVTGAYLSYIHDDCVQNDDLLAGTITNSYLDGCYVAFSARRSTGETFDGHSNIWNISNSLVRLQAMPTVYKGSAAGHGGFFKWDDSALLSPKLNLTNTVFRADQTTNHGDLLLPVGYDVTCSNNKVVWLGPGAFPGTASWMAACPDTVITSDRSVWDAAASQWDVDHPGVITGPEVSVGDTSVVEGDGGARSLQFPISLSAPPAPGKTVTVYWSTAPGTAGTADFTAKKGKIVFSGAQVFKTVAVAVKPDTVPEPNELMYLVAAGVDGGENHRERGTGTILNDDPGTGINLSVGDATVVEGDSGTRLLSVPVVLSNPATSDVFVTWSTVDGTAMAGSDYSHLAGTAKIPMLGRQINLLIPLLGDTISEGTESFSIVVSAATSATVIDNTGVVTILDDD